MCEDFQETLSRHGPSLVECLSRGAHHHLHSSREDLKADNRDGSQRKELSSEALEPNGTHPHFPGATPRPHRTARTSSSWHSAKLQRQRRQGNDQRDPRVRSKYSADACVDQDQGTAEPKCRRSFCGEASPSRRRNHADVVVRCGVSPLAGSGCPWGLKFAIARSAAVRTEDEIRRIREDAILHSRIMAPFSSEAPVAVDAPDLQTDRLRPRVSGMGSPVVGSVDSQKESSISGHSEPAVDGSSSLQISDTQTLVEEEYDDTIPQTNDQSHVSQTSKESQDFVQDDDPESPIFEADLFSNDESIEEEQLNKLQVWFGDLSRVGFDRRYLVLRDSLSDAAYSGQFESLFRVLADVEHAYAQSWANAPRLSKQCLVFGVYKGTVYPQVSDRHVD